MDWKITQDDLLGDRCLFYKEGIKYSVNRPIRLKLHIPIEQRIVLARDMYDIEGKLVKIPLAIVEISGWATIYPGYAWDGASGPTFDTLSSMRGSLWHDLLYQLIRLGYIYPKFKKYADVLMTVIMKQDKMWVWRADLWEWGVKHFAGHAILPSAERKELVAP